MAEQQSAELTQAEAAQPLRVADSLRKLNRRAPIAHTPASASAPGQAGTWAWDASYIYVCVDTDTWKRAALATW